MNEECNNNELADVMSSLSFDDSNAAFFAFNPPITTAIGSDEKVLFEYNVKVSFQEDPFLGILFKGSQFMEISSVKQKSPEEVVAELQAQYNARNQKVSKCTADDGPPTQLQYSSKLADLAIRKEQSESNLTSKRIAKAARSVKNAEILV